MIITLDVELAGGVVALVEEVVDLIFEFVVDMLVVGRL